jgi:hypothetical protein
MRGNICCPISRLACSRLPSEGQSAKNTESTQKQKKYRCRYQDDRSSLDTHRPNENKMSDGGRHRASLGLKVWKSSQKWSVQPSAVRSIAWLDAFV